MVGDNFVVRAKCVTKIYPLGQQCVEALRDVTLLVLTGEFMAVAGPSGSGKSTLLNLIGCIDIPTSGSIYIDGQVTTDRSADELAEMRARKIGFIFQTFNLLPVLSAFENVEYPLLRLGIEKRKRHERVYQYLSLVGLDRFARHRPNQLSGGQRQRVAIARALVTQPSIVLADEPTANLDHATGEGILDLMSRINQDNGTTFIFSTHDPRVIQMAGRVLNMSDGEIVNK